MIYTAAFHIARLPKYLADIYPNQIKKEFELSTELIKKLLQNKKHKLGKGATSTVYKVLNCFTNQGFLCLKILNRELFKKSTNQITEDDDFGDDDDNEFDLKDEEESEDEIDVDKVKQLCKEYELLFQLDHPNVVKVYGFFLGDKKLNPAILLEYCKFNLEEAIKKKLTDADLVSFIYEIIAAMKYVHKNKIIHYDLKMKNILITKDKHVKICDFGISKVVDVTTYTSFTTGIGTTAFMAPELVSPKGTYNEKVDVYAFGVVMYFILTKGEMPPFSGIGKYAKLELPSCINNFSQSIIKKCWSKDPNERPSFKEIKKLIVLNEFKLIDGVESEIVNILSHLGLK